MKDRNKTVFENGKATTTFDNGLHVRKLRYFREVIYGICLRKGTTYKFPCKFLHKNRMERLFEKGRKELKREMDIMSFLNDIRTIKANQKIIKDRVGFTKDDLIKVDKQVMLCLKDDFVEEQVSDGRVYPHETQASQIFRKRERNKSELSMRSVGSQRTNSEHFVEASVEE